MHHRTNRRLAAAARSARLRFATDRPSVEPLEGRRLMSATAAADESVTAAEPVAEPTGSISGFVFQDTNRDGTRSRDEALRGAVPYLDLNGNAAYDAGEPGGQLRSSFSFTGLAAGPYTLRFDPQAGTSLPPTTAPAGEPKYEIDLAPGQVVADRNLGFDVPTAIYGTVFEDRDRDGVRDPNEPGTFEDLYLDANGDRIFQFGKDVQVRATGSNGYYEVVGLAPGTYTLWRQSLGFFRQQTTPATPTWDGITTFTLAAGEVRQMPALGLAQGGASGTLKVPIYADWDQDGALDDGDTAPHPADLIFNAGYLDLNNNRARETNEPTGGYNASVFGGSPGYEFSNVPAGDYLFRMLSVDQGKTTVTSPSDRGSVLVTKPLTGSATAAPVMLHTPTPYTILGTLWDDANGNRVQDNGEAPLAGRTVWLDQNFNRRIDVGERRTETAGDGTYAFPNTPSSSAPYNVRQWLPDGWTETAPAFNQSLRVPTGATTAYRRDFGSARIYQRSADQVAAEAAEQTFDLGRFTPGLYSGVVTVDWGDGTPAESFGPLPNGPQSLIGPRPHAYADDGPYTVTVTITNGTGGPVLDAGTFGVAVANRPPAATLAGPATVNERTPTTFTFAAADPSPADTVTRWVIDWGDGTPAETFSGDVTSAVHAFPVGGGVRTVTATAYDEDGGAGAATLAVRVRTPAEAVADVRLAVDALSAAGRLTAAQHADLAKKLDAAQAAVVDGKTQKAVGQLSAFLDKVGGLVTGGVLTADEAGPLTADASAIVDLL